MIGKYKISSINETNYTATAEAPSRYNVEEIESYIDAGNYGFLPGSSAEENVTAFNSITSRKKIKITTPGVYEIDGTIWLESNTIIKFCSGCTIKPIANDVTPYTHIFANKGILSETRNNDIEIYGNGLILDVDLHDSFASAEAYRMKGHLNFFRVDGFILDNMYTDNTNGWQFIGHFADVSDFRISRFTVKSEKDAFHFNGLCYDGILSDILTDIHHDRLAFMATDWYIGTPVVGDIRNIQIIRWTDEHIVNPSPTIGAAVRINCSSWAAWESGNTYVEGSVCNNNGQIYISATEHYQTGTVAPVHTSGSVEGADGITWTWMQAGTFTEGNIENITFEDCDFNGVESRTISFFSASAEDDGLEVIYPGTEGNAYIDNIVFDNIRWTPTLDAQRFWVGYNYAKKVTFKNTTIDITATNTIFIEAQRAGTAAQNYQCYLEELIIDNCNITYPATGVFLAKAYKNTFTTLTITDSIFDMSDNPLFSLLATEHIDITLNGVQINSASELYLNSYIFDVDINASDCVFTDMGSVIYHTATGGVINFTADSCTFTEATEAFLFRSTKEGLTIDITNSAGVITQTKILDEITAFLNCDLLTEDGVGANLLENSYFDSDLSGWTVAVTAPNIVEWVNGEVHLLRSQSNDNSIREEVLTIGKTYRSIIDSRVIETNLAQEFGSATLGSIYTGKHVFWKACAGNEKYGIRSYDNSSEGYINSVIVQEVL